MNIRAKLLASAVIPCFLIAVGPAAAQSEATPEAAAEAARECPPDQTCPPAENAPEAPEASPAPEARDEAESPENSENADAEKPVEPDASENAAQPDAAPQPDSEAARDGDAAPEATTEQSGDGDTTREALRPETSGESGDAAATGEASSAETADPDAPAAAEETQAQDPAQPAEEEPTAREGGDAAADAPDEATSEAASEAASETDEPRRIRDGEGRDREARDGERRRESEGVRETDQAGAPSDGSEQNPERDPSASETPDAPEPRAEETEQETAQDEASAEAQEAAAEAQEAAAEDKTVEQQLEAQGDRDEAEQVRRLRGRLVEQLIRTLDAQSESGDARGAYRDGDRAFDPDRDADRAFDRDRDRDRDSRRTERRDRRDDDGRRSDWRRDRDGERRERFYGRHDGRERVLESRDGRLVIELDGDIFVESTVPDEGGRLLYGARDVEVQELRGGGTRTIVYRPNGVEVVTERDRYGDILKRTRRMPDGIEIVLFDARYDGNVERRRARVDVPRPRVDIPRERYVVDLGRASREDIRETLTAPPVDRLDRGYSLTEVLRTERLRAYSPRIDLDVITFDFGSAVIGENQMAALYELGETLERIIAENPNELYLIEGHTDAVGSEYDNLILSDKRAEAVAVALSQNFDIPPENLITEGYGEQFLKVETQRAERRNRRAAVVRLTDLVAQR